MPNVATVFVIDDDQAVCDSLTWLLSSVDLDVKTFPDAETFLGSCQAPQEGCLVIDVRIPGMSGLELQSELRSHDINLPVIIMTAYGDIQMAVRAMRQGAHDFFEKPYNDQQLLDSVLHAIELSKMRSQQRARLAETKANLKSLTPRQQEVLNLIVAGKSNKQIAYDLRITEKAVEAHRAKIMEKMHVRALAVLMRKVLSVSAPRDYP